MNLHKLVQLLKISTYSFIGTIPIGTSSTFIFSFSHKLASSLTYVILVARNAFDAYLISSAALLDVFIYFAPFDIKGEYKFLNILFDFLLDVPITTLSGYKIPYCLTFLKNSGLDTTLKYFFNFFGYYLFNFISSHYRNCRFIHNYFKRFNILS